MSLGRPVIATRCGGPEDIVLDTNGILVPKDDVEALASAMQTMQRTYSIYKPDEIRQVCIERYSEQVVSERLINVYSEVLDTKMHLKSQ